MIVMKFGGASVKNADSVKNVSNIILQHLETPTMVVISAMDKTTNALEALAAAAENGDTDAAQQQFDAIKAFHLAIVKDLFAESAEKIEEDLKVYFEEIRRIVSGILMLGEYPPLMYDRIVAYGELLSTQIVAAYIAQIGGNCTWLDARQFIKTDMQHRQAKVLWKMTEANIQNQVQPLLGIGKTLITQGFIASTLAGKTTTLGREGSDFTAAILAYCLNAEKVIIWKDVKGVLNADPRLKRPNTQRLSQLSYEQAVEMTFYGATVIHPKTIQPLYIKKIPLYVKSFVDTSLEGTCISHNGHSADIPIYIQKEKQVLLTFTAKDFGFMDAELAQIVLGKLQHVGAKINACQNSTLSFIVCIDSTPAIIKEIESELVETFVVQHQENVILYTTIQFSEEDLKEIDQALLVQIQGNTLCIVK